MNKVVRFVIILSIICFCIACDQATKSLAETHLSKKSHISFLNDTVLLRLAHNDGAFLSILSSMPRVVKITLLQAGVGAVLVALLIFVIIKKGLSTAEIVAYSLVIGGGIGNLIDRVVRDGNVTDFLNFGIGTLRTGILNIADIQITAGFVILLLFSFFQKSKKSAA